MREGQSNLGHTALSDQDSTSRLTYLKTFSNDSRLLKNPRKAPLYHLASCLLNVLLISYLLLSSDLKVLSFLVLISILLVFGSGS
ncbi:hypothetical protein PGT21_002333 [Puccinia graminis f. sp. tritici]|uniref:Uncharacterized protein n=1 Tax=Puccinia graminis f. sp. tritici TaxID=56615 RepID=A0A5B0MJR5_PUCGR|nr:hypothetical protein PGT21_002333 [Puccinia graminis f. sp. tritici]